MSSPSFFSPISSPDGSFSTVAFFDGYFSPFCGRSWEVIKDSNGKPSRAKDGKYLVAQRHREKNKVISWLKVLSYMTVVLPIMMGIGKLFCRSYYSFSIDVKKQQLDKIKSEGEEIAGSQAPNRPQVFNDQEISSVDQPPAASIVADLAPGQLLEKKRIKISVKQQTQNSIEILPTEIWVKIFSFLNKKELNHIAESCNKFYFIRNLVDENTKTDHFWLMQNGYTPDKDLVCVLTVLGDRRHFIPIDESISLQDFISYSDFHLKNKISPNCKIIHLSHAEDRLEKNGKSLTEPLKIQYRDNEPYIEEGVEKTDDFFNSNGIFLKIENPEKNNKNKNESVNGCINS